jgi:hypothetical protein
MRIIFGCYVLFCATLSILFPVVGYSGPDKPKSVAVGNWMHTGDEDSTDSKFVCPNGKLVGDVWETDRSVGVYGLHIYDQRSWDKIEENFKNEQFAKQAAEQFINSHKVCE